MFDGIVLPGQLVGGLELGLIFGTIGLLAIYDFFNISGQAIIGEKEENKEDFEAENNRYYRILPTRYIKKYNIKNRFYGE